MRKGELISERKIETVFRKKVRVSLNSWASIRSKRGLQQKIEKKKILGAHLGKGVSSTPTSLRRERPGQALKQGKDSGLAL